LVALQPAGLQLGHDPATCVAWLGQQPATLAIGAATAHNGADGGDFRWIGWGDI